MSCHLDRLQQETKVLLVLLEVSAFSFFSSVSEHTPQELHPQPLPEQEVVLQQLEQEQPDMMMERYKNKGLELESMFFLMLMFEVLDVDGLTWKMWADVQVYIPPSALLSLLTLLSISTPRAHRIG